MPCDFESLYYNLKQELLELFQEAESPVPRVKLRELKSARVCGLVNLAKLVLYFEVLGIVMVVNREEHYQEWEIDIQAQVLDVLFEQI
ncbi:hypothetical protein [Hydrogenivirga sp.]